MISLTSLVVSDIFGGGTREETIPAASLISFAFFLAAAVIEDKYGNRMKLECYFGLSRLIRKAVNIL